MSIVVGLLAATSLLAAQDEADAARRCWAMELAPDGWMSQAEAWPGADGRISKASVNLIPPVISATGGLEYWLQPRIDFVLTEDALSPSGRKSGMSLELWVNTYASGEGAVSSATAEIVADGERLAGGPLVWDEKLRSLGLVTVRSIRTGRLIIDEPSEQVLRKLDRAAAIVATVQTSNGEVWEVRYAGLKRQAVRAKRAWAIDALRRAAAGHKLSSVTKMASCDSVE